MFALRNRDSAFFISFVIAALLIVAAPLFALATDEPGQAVSAVSPPATVLAADVSEAAPVAVETPAAAEAPVAAAAPAGASQGVTLSLVVEATPENTPGLAAPQVVEAPVASDEIPVEIGTACVIEADGTSTGCE